jgi:hypothetical protein
MFRLQEARDIARLHACRVEDDQNVRMVDEPAARFLFKASQTGAVFCKAAGKTLIATSRPRFVSRAR